MLPILADTQATAAEQESLQALYCCRVVLLGALQSAFEKAHQASLAVYDDPPSCISYPIDTS
jgi:hypothetical protein